MARTPNIDSLGKTELLKRIGAKLSKDDLRRLAWSIQSGGFNASALSGVPDPELQAAADAVTAQTAAQATTRSASSRKTTTRGTQRRKTAPARKKTAARKTASTTTATTRKRG